MEQLELFEQLALVKLVFVGVKLVFVGRVSERGLFERL
jgi:hypothetical protein